MRALLASVLLLLPVARGLRCSRAAPDTAPEVRVGSKKFTESVILGELVARLARSAGARAVHRRELGGTTVLWEALKRGELDVYPEYTGTLRQELFASRGLTDDAGLREALAAEGLGMSALARLQQHLRAGDEGSGGRAPGHPAHLGPARAPASCASASATSSWIARTAGPRCGIATSSPSARCAGWIMISPTGALESGAIQVTDLYSTDAEIAAYGLRVLEDDLKHFPAYDAVLLYREDWARRHPEVLAGHPQAGGAASPSGRWCSSTRAPAWSTCPRHRWPRSSSRGSWGCESETRADGLGSRVWLPDARAPVPGARVAARGRWRWPCRWGCSRRSGPRVGQVVLGLAGIVQTVPSLALLVVMIPLLGIGSRPAIVALFLYGLLPIVRNTAAGLGGIPGDLRESAEALGLPPRARLWRIELPLAAPSILAGIQTAAVINVGTATLGALIGAGGYGQPILTGIRLDDTGLILEGAVPAALLALAVSAAVRGARTARGAAGAARVTGAVTPASALSQPIPELAPVTMATFLASIPMVSLLGEVDSAPSSHA